jgi:tellurite resistance protein
MNDDLKPFHRFTGPARLEKAVNSLVGIVEGVCIDGIINATEIGFIRSWLHENRALENCHPFNELMPVIVAAIADGILTDDERLNILWLCERMQSSACFDVATAAMQRLHALLAGIAADSEITEKELRGLSDWLSNHEHLKTCWPYEEVEGVVSAVLRDGRIDAEEHKLLQNFFSEFVAISDNQTIVNPRLAEAQTFVGLCAICPDMLFEGKRFSFTGTSSKYSRAQFGEIVERLGGIVSGSVSKKLDYLIIGADGNPCWAYACYGRKVEMAVTLRKEGARILLIHENDFHDAVADLT